MPLKARGNYMVNAERFWSNAHRGTVEECWPWRRHTNRRGYGMLAELGSHKTRRQVLAHRVAFELFYARKIPDGLLVLHACDNPGCVNPAHLFLGAHADNMRDAKTKGRVAWGSRVGTSKLTADIVRGIRGLYEAGHRQKDIAGRYGIAQAYVSEIVTGKKWSRLDGYGDRGGGHMRGEDHIFSKLTNDDVKQIRNEYRRGTRGCGQRELAKRYNVSRRTIQRIVNGEGWKHVP